MLISVRTPKSVEVHARLDCKAGAGQQAAIVVGFVIVHVHAVAVDRLAEAVTGSMQNLVAVAAPPSNTDEAARSTSQPCSSRPARAACWTSAIRGVARGGRPPQTRRAKRGQALARPV